MKKLLVTIFILGLIIRLYFAGLATPGIFWDMETFHNYALTMRSGSWAADCCVKNLGYSAFLAVIYRFFGPENTTAVQMIQVILDSLNAFLVMVIAARLSDRRSGIIAFILYTFNPFTASFTGFRLSEIPTVTSFLLAGLILTNKNISQKFPVWYLFGITLGLIVFMRQQYWLYAIFIMVILPLLSVRKYLLRFFGVFLIAIGMASVLWYPAVANYQVFGEVRITPKYADVWASGLYGNFYRTTRYPEISGVPGLSPEFAALDYEHHTTPLEERGEHQSIYREKFLERIRSDWPLFINNTLRNLFWLWDKEYLFVYDDPWYPADRIPVRAANLLVLLLAALGVVSYIKQQGKAILNQPFFVFTLGVFAYISLIFPMLSNESRHTIAVYGLVMVWAGYGLAEFTAGLKTIFGKS